MNSTDKTPIVLIHGLWMTPASWNTWAERYRAKGHEVIVPGWPGIDDRSVEDIRRDPSALKGVGLKQIVDHYERIIRALPVTPIIMGHSFGGVITQMLADRGVGAAYVGVAPGQTAGITTLPCRRSGPAPRSCRTLRPQRREALSKRHFHFTFGNDLSRADSDRLWEESAVNSYNRVFFEGVASAFNEKEASRTSTTPAPTVHRSTSSPVRSTTSCRRPSVARSCRSTAPPGAHPSWTTRSTPHAPTDWSARTAGRRSPTTPSTGPSRTPPRPSREGGDAKGARIRRSSPLSTVC